MIIQPIVEGDGEIGAVPTLLRRLISEAGSYCLEVAKPIKRRRCHFIRREEVQRSVALALARPNCGAILLMFDADDDCPKMLASQVKQWADDASNGRVRCEVVINNREYEAWFLASIESLRGQRGIRRDAEFTADCEGVRGAKEAFEDRMERDIYYHEPTDQPAFTAIFDLRAAFAKSRSFRRMVAAFNNIAVLNGCTTIDLTVRPSEPDGGSAPESDAGL
jgi:hypothetical protein